MAQATLFTQETCGACETQREKNDGLEDEYPDVEFREIAIQADLGTVEEYGVRKTPTTLVYANGRRTAEFVGIVDRSERERGPAIVQTHAAYRRYRAQIATRRTTQLT